jgi:hypothetical protein
MWKGSGGDAERRHKLYKSSPINVTLFRRPLLSRFTSRLVHVSSRELVMLSAFASKVMSEPPPRLCRPM